MDFLKSQLDRIQQQLGALTATQKMLTATLVALMVLTLVWWGRLAGTSEMEPVLDQAMSQDDAARATAELTAKHIEYKVSGDRILVPAERKFEALAVLSYNNALPHNTASGFDDIIKQISPWDGVNHQNAMFNHGKELTLSQIISQFPDVASAVVMIDPHNERRIESNVESTAAVMIQMKSGARAGRQLVKAAASAVAGAQSGLAMRNIRVEIDGMPQKVVDDESADGLADGDSIHELRQAEENRLAQKLRDQFQDIPGVLVSVTVSVSDQSTDTQQTTVEKNKSWQAEERIQSETHEQGSGASTAADTGAGPNTALSVAAPVAGGETTTSTENKEDTTFHNFPGGTTTHTKIVPGQTMPVSASVRIPHSYFVQVARDLAGGKDPDAKVIRDTIDDEKTKTITAVMKTIGLAKPEDVSVEVYADPLPLASISPATSTAASVTSALGGHVKEIGLGALALASLFMVSSMVRKSMPPPPVVTEASPDNQGPTVLPTGETLVGEAADSNTVLNGVELDEDQVRAQQMMGEVARLVDDNPDAAATLIRRWMNRT